MGNKFTSRTLNNVKTSAAVPAKTYQEALGYEMTPEMLDECERLLKYQYKTENIGRTELDGVPVIWVEEEKGKYKKGYRRLGFYVAAPDGFPYTIMAFDSDSMRQKKRIEDFNVIPEFTTEDAIEDFNVYWHEPRNVKYRLNEQPQSIRREMSQRLTDFKVIAARVKPWGELTSLNTVPDAEKWLQQQPGMEDFFFDITDKAPAPSPEVLNRLVGTLAEMHKKFPSVLGNLTGITIVDPTDYRDRDGNEVRNESNLAAVHGFGSCYMTINLTNIEKTEKEWAAAPEKAFKKRWALTDSLESVLIHELGHVIDNQNGCEYIIKSEVGDGTLNDIWQTFTVWKNNISGKPYRSRFAGQLDKRATRVARDISRYAAVSPQELFAEAFAWTVNDANRNLKVDKIDQNPFCISMREFTVEYRAAVSRLCEKYQHLF